MPNRRIRYFGYLLAVLALVGAYWLFGNALETGKPEILIHQDVDVIGQNKVVDVTFSDRGSGLRDIEISLRQGEKTRTLYTASHPQKGIPEKKISVTIAPQGMKMQDGPAMLDIKAVDYSLFKNQTVLSKAVTIDMVPPQIHPQDPQNIINPGGTCVALYRISKPAAVTGAKVDDRFFPAYPAVLSGKHAYIVYFSVPVGASQGLTRISLFARDRAGNECSVSLPHVIRKKNFRSDKMMLSNAFLQQKMPEFQMNHRELHGKNPVETFVHVNEVLRRDNYKTIQSLTRQSEARQLWSGPFARMKNAAPMALFGDRRTYFFEGRMLGESLHEGVDLASVQQAPVESANSGIVVFAGPLGIYGNTVIIDHGFGLFSLYAHLSAMHVKPAQTVRREEVIGRSGLTGLAGGDHLHFSMLAGGTFVNPVEWWDAKWIADNVTRKTAMAR